MVVAAALAGRADILVTLDRHLLDLAGRRSRLVAWACRVADQAASAVLSTRSR